jgi:hypothetical protein
MGYSRSPRRVAPAIAAVSASRTVVASPMLSGPSGVQKPPQQIQALFRPARMRPTGYGAAGVRSPPRFDHSPAWRDDQYYGIGAFLRRVFWWRHCSIAGPRVTWPKLRPRSSG